MTLQDTLDKVSKSVKDALNSVDKKYKESTHHGSGRGSLKSNSGFHSDAKHVAREAERLKDKALADADRRA
jgi:hypothetical protein